MYEVCVKHVHVITVYSICIELTLCWVFACIELILWSAEVIMHWFCTIWIELWMYWTCFLVPLSLMHQTVVIYAQVQQDLFTMTTWCIKISIDLDNLRFVVNGLGQHEIYSFMDKNNLRLFELYIDDLTLNVRSIRGKLSIDQDNIR